MKAIKLTAANLPAIKEALILANGNACSHTFNADDILDVVTVAEGELVFLLGNKKDMVGAMAFARSGCALPNAYKYGRQVNTITIQRRASGWWLVSIVRFGTTDKSGESVKVALTTEQDAKAVARFQKTYQMILTQKMVVESNN
jgi:hypothetical protein